MLSKFIVLLIQERIWKTLYVEREGYLLKQQQDMVGKKVVTQKFLR